MVSFGRWIMPDHPELFDHQKNFLDDVGNLASPARACIYFKTGAGKSLTSMLGMKKLGFTDVLVICPPATHLQWEALADSLGMTVLCMSHAKFRMKTVKVSRHQAIIADEFHLFGGQGGQGWRKLDALARGLQAPLFLLSATPNYNDAERCYCIQHVLDPQSVRGGYLQFIYQNCTTEQNPFGMEPRVTGFQRYSDAAEFLAAMPGVYYLADDLVVNITDIPYKEDLPDELTRYNYDRRQHRMVASIIEWRHTARYQGLVGEDGYLHPDVLTEVLRVLLKSKVVLIYSNHATIAEVVGRTLQRSHVGCQVVTGRATKFEKEHALLRFGYGTDVLIGTATLATGTDGLDRVCDTLLILDDTDDDALRRQLIGRIMPRGDFVSIAAKEIFRLVPA
jgi:superfamily II DNA or RNA helicase